MSSGTTDSSGCCFSRNSWTENAMEEQRVLRNGSFSFITRTNHMQSCVVFGSYPLSQTKVGQKLAVSYKVTSNSILLFSYSYLIRFVLNTGAVFSISNGLLIYERFLCLKNTLLLKSWVVLCIHFLRINPDKQLLIQIKQKASKYTGILFQFISLFVFSIRNWKDL